MRPVVVSLMCSLLWPASLAAQLVFEPKVVAGSIDASYVSRMDLGDIDGDGDCDAVLSSGDAYGIQAYMEKFINDGTGKLVAASKQLAGDSFRALHLFDFDGDDTLDLVSAQGTSIRLRRGQPDGLFGAEEIVYAPQSATVYHIELVELTGDEHTDIVAMENGVVELLPGLGGGSVGAPLAVADLGALAAYQARAGDLDGDGLVDLIVVAYLPIWPPLDSEAHIFMATSPGAFTEAETCVLGPKADVELVSLDGDDLPDLAYATASGVSVRLGEGSGGFLPPAVVDASDFGTGLAAADFDGDGDVDLASIRPELSQIVLWTNDGSGGFAENLRVTHVDAGGDNPASPYSMRPLMATDMNGDGKLDLVRTAIDYVDQVHVTVIRNHTYAPDSPFLDLGYALTDPSFLAGPADFGPDFPGIFAETPILLVDGDLQPSTHVRLRICRNGVGADHAWLILGVNPLLAALRGGTLVPTPDLIFGPMAFNGPKAVIDLDTIMPAGVPQGFQFWMQAWCAPSTPFEDVSATSAVRATAP